MRWIKRKILKWASDDGAISGGCYIDKSSPESEPTMNFKIYNATGGKIVEFRQYDRKNDNIVNKLYIIDETADFGDSIKKIAMIHLMSV
jgi:hypothetical protein